MIVIFHPGVDPWRPAVQRSTPLESGPEVHGDQPASANNPYSHTVTTN